MSYNTRRGGGNFNQMNTGTSVGNIGQRRPQGPPLSSNFVSGGQLAQGNKPQQQQQQQYQQKQPISQQQQQPQQQQGYRQQQPSQQQQQQQQQPPPQQQQPPPQQQQPPAQFTPPVKQENSQMVVEGDTNGDDGGQVQKKRPFWMKRQQGKISKKERLRRRNMRLRKILQPKNALMVLNELVGSATYNTSDGGEGPDAIFRASVTVNGIDHVGIGKSKALAKQAAAENALKHMVLSKLKVEALSSSVKSESDGEESSKMDTSEEDDGQDGVSWSHVASYALHKLLTSWDEGGNLSERIAQATAASASPELIKKVLNPAEKRPAKKLPENAAMMNPIMLLNQMRPNAIYEEVSKTGSPPNIQFTMKCTTDDEVFLGIGPNKKAARKQCAYAACKKVLAIQYPPEIVEAEGLDKLPASTPMQMG